MSNATAGWLARVQVVDAHGRERAITIGISNGRVAVLVPPGEGFTMARRDALAAAEAIQDAAKRARSR